MSTIDPKWIQIDDSKLEVIVRNDRNELSIKEGLTLTGVSAEYVNGTKITVSATAPEGTITQQDIWIETL